MRQILTLNFSIQSIKQRCHSYKKLIHVIHIDLCVEDFEAAELDDQPIAEGYVFEFEHVLVESEVLGVVADDVCPEFLRLLLLVWILSLVQLSHQIVGSFFLDKAGANLNTKRAHIILI